MTVNNPRKRIFGDKIGFKSISCAPVNELGVVYLFGVLHETFDFRIESIQAGFPDCIARKRLGPNRWEEVRIEFEYDSKSFLSHGHNPNSVDVIVCWTHNWTACPSQIEVIELSSLLGTAEQIDNKIKTSRHLNAWQRFCGEKRQQGLTFSEIAKLYREQRKNSVPKKSLQKKIFIRH